MTSTTSRVVIGGVDTHGHTHHAAAIDEVGRQLGDREFTATPAGYRALAAWLGQHGTLETIGVEGTGAYGAGCVPAIGSATRRRPPRPRCVDSPDATNT